MASVVGAGGGCGGWLGLMGGLVGMGGGSGGREAKKSCDGSDIDLEWKGMRGGKL